MPKLSARPEPISLAWSQTALLIVDMQNAFAAKGGMFDIAGFDISGAARAVANTALLAAEARRTGVRVVYLQMSYRADLSDGGGPDSPNYQKELGLRLMRARPDLAGKLLVEGSWDWKIVDILRPEPDDWVVRKSRYSGFCGSDLEERLRGAGIRNLLFTGIAANICVESTARDAYFAEFWPILVEDGVNHSGPDHNRLATIWAFENVFGWVTDTACVIDALRKVG